MDSQDTLIDWGLHKILGVGGAELLPQDTVLLLFS